MNAQLSAATHKTLSRAWNKLTTKHFAINGFNSLNELLAEFPISQCAGPYPYRLSRIDGDMPFEPGNVRLSQVQDDEELAALIHPAI